MDSNDRERINEAKDELSKMVSTGFLQTGWGLINSSPYFDKFDTHLYFMGYRVVVFLSEQHTTSHLNVV